MGGGGGGGREGGADQIGRGGGFPLPAYPAFPACPALFASNRGGPNRRDGEHDTQSDDDERGNHEPDCRHPLKEAGLPEGEAGANQQNEVADQIQVNEPHGVYRCKLTTRAARRLSRRVSSRLLSYFGRSSP